MAPTLTKDQEEACDKFMRFLISNEKEFYLFGSAGSGKTFLIRHLIDQMKTKFVDYCQLLGLPVRRYSYCYTATTNKAAAVLSEAVGESVSTIYSLFGIKVIENFRTGKTNLECTNAPDIKDSIIFVDECSMLSRRALSLLRELCPKSCRLVFVGDNNQLAPVNEKPYWNDTPERTTAYLSIPVRNKESKNLMELCKQLKATVQTGKFFKIVPDDVSIIKATDKIAENFLQNFNPKTDIVLAYTNETVEKYSEYIKEFCPNIRPENEVWVNIDHYVNGYEWGETQQTKPSFYPEQRFYARQQHGTTELKLPCGITYTCEMVRIRDFASNTLHFVDVLNYQYKQKLLNKLANLKKWKDFYYIKNGTMSLRTAYATTVHKSQGSTYDRVFIDLDSFNACRDKETLTRLLYVAVSRARKQVVFYGSVNLEKWHHAG